MPIITEMYAFCSKDSPNGEGILAINTGDWWQPLVGADMERVEALRPIAVQLGRASGIDVVLKRFRLIEAEIVYTAKPA